MVWIDQLLTNNFILNIAIFAYIFGIFCWPACRLVAGARQFSGGFARELGQQLKLYFRLRQEATG